MGLNILMMNYLTLLKNKVMGPKNREENDLGKGKGGAILKANPTLRAQHDHSFSLRRCLFHK